MMQRAFHTFPAPWRWPVPLHPSCVVSLLHPATPQHNTPRILVVRVQDQWWFGAARDTVSAALRLGLDLASASSSTMLQRRVCDSHDEACEAIRAFNGWKDVPHFDTTQRALLCVRALLDWRHTRAEHTQLPHHGLDWWRVAYGADASTRTLHRARRLLQESSEALIESVWRGDLTINTALRLVAMVPTLPEQDALLNRAGVDGVQQLVADADKMDHRHTQLLIESPLYRHIFNLAVQHRGDGDAALAQAVRALLDNKGSSSRHA